MFKGLTAFQAMMVYAMSAIPVPPVRVTEDVVESGRTTDQDAVRIKAASDKRARKAAKRKALLTRM